MLKLQGPPQKSLVREAGISYSQNFYKEVHFLLRHTTLAPKNKNISAIYTTLWQNEYSQTKCCCREREREKT